MLVIVIEMYISFTSLTLLQIDSYEYNKDIGKACNIYSKGIVTFAFILQTSRV